MTKSALARQRKAIKRAEKQHVEPYVMSASTNVEPHVMIASTDDRPFNEFISNMNTNLELVDSHLPQAAYRATYRKCLSVTGSATDNLDTWNVHRFNCNAMSSEMWTQYEQWDSMLRKHGLGYCTVYTWMIAVYGRQAYDQKFSSFVSAFWNYL